MKNSKKVYYNRGLIKFIFIIIALLVLLAYLGLNLRSIVSSPTFVDNWAFIKSTVSTVWFDYLRTPVLYLFNDIFIPYIWEPISESIRNKNSTS